MEKRAKMGRNALRIIGIVYAILGTVFLAVGASVFLLGNDSDMRIVGGVFSLIGGIFGLLGGIFLAAELREPLNKSSAAEQRIFSLIRAVSKVGNTYRIPPLLKPLAE